MTRTVAVLGLALLTLLTLAVAPATAQNATSNETATDWDPPGPFDRAELTTGGTHDPQAPPSVREVGNPVRGAVGVRYRPASPLQSEPNWLKPTQRVETDTLQLYGSTYGSATGEYTVVIVYWQEATKQVGNETVTYAANQTVQRISVNLSSGYSTVPIKLYSHYQQSPQATMWLERDGDRVDGARWRFVHRSNPLTASPAFPVNSKGDLWRWGAINILLPAVPGILVGRKTATHVLDRTITGTRKSTLWWAIIVGGIVLGLTAMATWQTAAVLSRAPFVAGLAIAALSFVTILGVRDREVERAEFNRKDIEDTTAVTGSDSKRARTEEIRLRDIVRREGKIFMPATGLRPFLARYWAEPAHVDESDLVTVNNCEGDVSKKYEIDPQADQVLNHTPAHMSFDPTILQPRDGDRPESMSGLLSETMDRLNTQFLLVAIGGGAAVYWSLHATLGLTSLAAVAALLPGVIAGYEARDGSLEFEPAPYHFSEARGILATERETYREARTFEDLHALVADLDLDVIEQTQETTEAVRDQLRDRIREMFDVPTEETVGSDGDDGDGDGTAGWSPDREPGVSD